MFILRSGLYFLSGYLLFLENWEAGLAACFCVFCQFIFLTSSCYFDLFPCVCIITIVFILITWFFYVDVAKITRHFSCFTCVMYCKTMLSKFRKHFWVGGFLVKPWDYHSQFYIILSYSYKLNNACWLFSSIYWKCYIIIIGTCLNFTIIKRIPPLSPPTMCHLLTCSAKYANLKYEILAFTIVVRTLKLLLLPRLLVFYLFNGLAFVNRFFNYVKSCEVWRLFVATRRQAGTNQPYRSKM